MIRCALESFDPGNFFNNLNVTVKRIENFLEPPEVKNIMNTDVKSQISKVSIDEKWNFTVFVFLIATVENPYLVKVLDTLKFLTSCGSTVDSKYPEGKMNIIFL